MQYTPGRDFPSPVFLTDGAVVPSARKAGMALAYERRQLT